MNIETGLLSTERITLRTLRKQDLPVLMKLISDSEPAYLTGEVYPVTEGKLEDFYNKNQATDTRIWFLIIDRKSGNIIGETGFLRIFYPWRTSDYSLIIWDRNFHGRGYGAETAGMMLEYGFNYLNFHRLAIGVVAENRNAVKFWKKVGFVEEGVQRDGFFSKGKFSDFIMMSMLESEYRFSR